MSNNICAVYGKSVEQKRCWEKLMIHFSHPKRRSSSEEGNVLSLVGLEKKNPEEFLNNIALN